MNSTDKEHLYNLLPAIYRTRDKKEGEPLRALLSVIETELHAIENDIEGLYDNWFIETCEDWVVPYIGDLLGVQNLHDIGSGFSQRAYVANTLAYRRRKGTPSVIEQLARDVTGWNARVVEFFNLIATTQNMNHIRPACTIMNLRDAEGLDILGGPFENAAHTVDVRRIDRNGGRYNIPNIGIFLWRIKSYSINRSTARTLGNGRFTFSPLGNDAPLFNQPQTEKDITHLAEEVNVPGMLRRRALREDLEKYHEAYLFSWNDIPGNDDKRVIGFLKKRFDIEWVDNAEIEKVDDGKTIKIYFENNFLSLKLNDDETKAILKIDDGRTDEFIAKKEKDKLNIYREPIKTSEAKPHSCYFGDTPVLAVFANDLEKRPENLMICDLSNWDAPGWAQVAVDPVLGRLLFLNESPTQLEVSYSYGFSGDIGGGPYERELITAGQEKEYLFSWDEIPGSDDRRLKEFLMQKFGMDWVKTANIKIIDKWTRGVLTEKESLSLKLIYEKTKPYLEIDNDKIYEVVVKEEEGKLNIYGKDIWKKTVSQDIKADFQTLSSALEWANSKASAIITITDNRTYEVSDPIVLGDDQYLVIQANNGNRPMLRMIDDNKNKNVATLNVSGGNGSNTRLILNGLLIEGGIDVKNLGQLKIVHCTLVPGWSFLDDGYPNEAFKPSVNVTNMNAEVEIDHSITGPLCLPAEIKGLSVRDSIIDSHREQYAISDGNDGAGPSTTIELTTVFGKVHVKELTGASNVIFTDTVTVDRRQQNCMRYSFVPDGSQTPRRYRCQPDFKIAKQIEDDEKKAQAENTSFDTPRRELIKTEVRSRLVPTFTSTQYGDPGYGQLHTSCPEQIRTGADDGSEMGAFHYLKQPQRVANLRAALNEYLRFGLEAGILYVDENKEVYQDETVYENEEKEL